MKSFMNQIRINLLNTLVCSQRLAKTVELLCCIDPRARKIRNESFICFWISVFVALLGFPFFPSWVSKSQPDHWTKRMKITRSTTWDPRNCPRPEDRSALICFIDTRWGRSKMRHPVALGSSLELSTLTMLLAPPVHPPPIFLTDTENL